jgi:hypothetical protein
VLPGKGTHSDKEASGVLVIRHVISNLPGPGKACSQVKYQPKQVPKCNTNNVELSS